MRFFYILFFGISVFLISCSDESGPDISELNGLVRDYDLGIDGPIENAQISTIPPSEVVLSDSYGRFSIRTPDAGDFIIVAKHKNYYTTQEVISVSYDYTATVNVMMKRMPDSLNNTNVAFIYGKVKDDDSKEVLKNVEIKIEPLSILTTSNAFGQFTAEIPYLGTYSVTFEKDGYETVSKTVNIDNFISYALNIEMKKEVAGKAEPLFYEDAVRYWSFDDNYNEVITGKSSVLYNEVLYENGIADKGVVLKNNSFITLADTDFKSMSEFSVSIWIKHLNYSNYNGGGYLVCGSIKDGYLGILNAIKPINIQTDEKRYLYFAAGAKRDANNESEDIQPIFLDFDYDNAWTHYTLTFKNDILKAYINGELKSQTQQTVKYNPDTFLLGAHLVDAQYESVITRVDAVYDELVIYNREMTDSEVKQIYEHY
jgi:hypothetical protein